MRKILHKKLLLNVLLIIILFSSKTLQSQEEPGISEMFGKVGMTTMLRDYQAIGINPANLGLNDNNRISLGLGYAAFEIQSRALDFKQMENNIKHPTDSLTAAQKQNYAKLFTTDGGLNLSANLNWFGLSIFMGRLGGIAFSMRDRINMHLTANQNLSDLIFEGTNANLFSNPNYKNENVSYILNGTSLNISHTREFNVAYGVKVFEIPNFLTLSAGIGYRYILGITYVNITADQQNLNAVTCFNASDYDFNTNNFKSIYQNLTTSGGTGSAYDLGATALLLKRFKVGASICDIGSITWNKNSLQGINIKMKPIDSLQKILQTGQHSINVFNPASMLVSQNGLLSFTDINSFKTNFQSKFRLGVGMKVARFLELGADVMVPLNNVPGYTNTKFYSIGGELNLGLLKLSSGITGNSNLGWNMPVGVTLSLFSIIEIYAATDDILTFENRTKNPYLSFAVCALRINIPHSKTHKIS